ncbi:hypothetical protein GUJ93_ZPchr0011g27282 [Zizania palustris]|uniref:Uncharacterized protein n=1 Tax=Zizania palustris TaxID=103762 RepID=A0A8J5WDY6_ZIZPA|nr:hypothetical protein GUJ93_ZPchr0011g27282 [Zizania palustris]
MFDEQAQWDWSTGGEDSVPSEGNEMFTVEYECLAEQHENEGIVAPGGEEPGQQVPTAGLGDGEEPGEHSPASDMSDGEAEPRSPDAVDDNNLDADHDEGA